MAEVQAVGTSASRQTALELSGKRKLGHAKAGLLWGAFGGMSWGFAGIILGIAFTMAPFTGGATIYTAGLVGSAMHDGFAGIFLTFYNIINGRGSEIFRTLKTWPGVLVCLAALFGGPIAMGGYLLGIQFAGAAYALSITACFPVIGTLLAWIFLKEKITPLVWGGIICCVAGAIIVGYTPPDGAAYPHFYLGIGCALLACFGWGIEGVLSTFGMDMVDPDIAIAVRESVSCIVSLVGVLPFVAGWAMIGESFTNLDSLWILALAGCIGGVSYLAWYKSLNMTGVGRAMALNITYVIWGLIFGFFMTDLELTRNLIIGGCVITFGGVLVVCNPKELLNLRG
ncbi:MAG: DMT family transporter [Desulfuromonas sp.]|nr:DMT family transporter [Desulfuromonas sp.]